MFDNYTMSLFKLQNKQTFRILSLRDLRLVLCSLDLDVLRAQRIVGCFYFNYPQINEVGNPIIGTDPVLSPQPFGEPGHPPQDPEALRSWHPANSLSGLYQ